MHSQHDFRILEALRMGEALTQAEVDRRLVRLRNLERLYEQQKERNRKLAAENWILKARVAKQDELIEKLMVRVEELETKLFGRRHRSSNQKDSPRSGQGGQRPEPKDDGSGQTKLPRRPNPRENEVTEELPLLSVSTCKHCGGTLSEFEHATRFIEDIDIAALINKVLKTVTKLTVERGKCQHCGRWTSAADLRGQTCTLGPNVKLVIPYLITVLDQTYEQVKQTLHDFFGLAISDAEITRILAQKRLDWLPEYHRLNADIRGQPGNHLDETTWNIQTYAKHCFAWIKAGTENLNVLFKLAASRGKGNAQELLGDFSGVRITDGYNAYANLPGEHQLCWAHLIRKARELAELSSLPDDKQKHCRKWYGRLCLVYQTLEQYRAEPFEKDRRGRQADRLLKQVKPLCQPHPLDPHKLKNLKQHILDYQNALFTCLTHDGIPSDNNRAERDLRPLVIKRKKSFGSKTEQGAKVLEVILSVVWSTWRRDRDNFWQHLAQLETNAQNSR